MIFLTEAQAGCPVSGSKEVPIFLLLAAYFFKGKKKKGFQKKKKKPDQMGEGKKNPLKILLLIRTVCP